MVSEENVNTQHSMNVGEPFIVPLYDNMLHVQPSCEVALTGQITAFGSGVKSDTNQHWGGCVCPPDMLLSRKFYSHASR